MIHRTISLVRATALAALIPAVSGSGVLGSGLPAAAAGCAPTTNDAYAQAVLADHPAAYYRLDEPNGPDLCDASGNNRNGTYAGSRVLFGVSGALHSSGNVAMSADGSGPAATGGGESGIKGSQDFSLEAWFMTTTRQDQMAVSIGQSAAPQNSAGIGVWSNDSSCCGGDKDLVVFDTFVGFLPFDAGARGLKVFDGQWHYIAGVYEANFGRVTMYLDGHTLGINYAGERILPSPVRVGWWVDQRYNQPFKGGLDEIAVYPTALPPSRVGIHYTAGSTYPTPSPQGGVGPKPGDASLPFGRSPGDFLVVILVLGLAPLVIWALARVARAYPPGE